MTSRKVQPLDEHVKDNTPTECSSKIDEYEEAFEHYDHTVDPIIDSGKVPVASLIIWATAAMFYLYEYILRVSPSVMSNSLMHDYGVTSTALGVLVSFYYYAYVPLQIPCGVIVDRFGARRVIAFSALFCTIGSVVFAQSDSLMTAQFGRFLMGAGSACAYLSTAKVTAEWFPASKFALITCITQGMGTIGGTFGGRPFAILVNQFGWRNAMMIAAVAGACVMLAAWFIIRDKHETASKQQPHEKVEHTFLGGLKVITRNPQSWLIGMYGCFMYLPLSAFAELWAVPYLMQSQGINNEIAAMASIMVFIGVAVGAPAGAWLSDQLQSRLKVMRFSAFLTAALFVIVVYVPELPLSVVLGLLFASGVVAGGQVLYFAAAKEINPPQISATTVGFTNSLVMLSGIVFQPLLGFLLDFVWDGKRGLDGIPMYTTHDYQIALSPVPFFLFIAWLVLKFVKETYPKE